MDPILLKIGFSGIDGDDICDLTQEQSKAVVDTLKRFDVAIGSWTLVHDIPANENRPQWRLSAEVCPLHIQNAKIEETEEENSRKVLCIDLEGVGIFIGKPKKEEEEESDK